MLVPCVFGVRLGYIGVVLNTVRESATPDSKENNQADAGSRRFSKTFSVRRVVVYLFIGTAWRSIYTYSRLYAQNPVFEIVHEESVNVFLHIFTTGVFSETPACIPNSW